MIKRLFSLLFFISALLITSCRSDNQVLEKEDLFIIPMGVTAGELDYFYRSGSLLPGLSDLFVLNGRIFISSSHAGKVIELNSYGDLLSLIYNPQTNPEPVHYQKQDDDQESLIRIKKWNFRNIEHIAVNDRGLFIVDQVEENLVSQSGETLYNRIVLIFNEEGEYVDSLGQEGINGTPFAYVKDLQLTREGQIVVITKSVSENTVYWFSSSGSLLYKIILGLDQLPVPEEGAWGQGQIEKISADPEGEKIYLKLSYFPKDDSQQDSTLNRLYTLDLEKGEYTGFFEIPRFNINLGDQTIEGVNEYLGAVDGGLHFFMGSDYGGRYHLTVMDNSGAVKTSRVLNIEDQDIIYKNIFLNPSGLLSGIFYEDNGARISWWRADRIAERYAED